MKKTKKFDEFSKNLEVGLDISKNTQNNEVKLESNESIDDLKKAAQTIGIDLTKNLSKRIDLI